MPPNAKQILIVEDERTLAQALSLKLTSVGFGTDICGTGKEAIDKVVANTYDLILLDLVMPEMDGFAVLAKLREMKNITPVIATSNLGQEEDMRRAQELGATAYIVKSHSSLSAIVNIIKGVLAV